MRMLRALGERSLAEVRRKQGHAAEALALTQSAMSELLALQAAGFADPRLPREISTCRERLGRMKVSVGDLDGALADFKELLRTSDACGEEDAKPAPACQRLGVRLSWTADVYAAVDRPNLNEPANAVPLYERALHIQERLAALDDHDRQARFDVAARFGKLGDALWSTDPERALVLYERALTTAKTLASKEQVEMLRGSYLMAVSRPLIQLGRLAEARTALTELFGMVKTDASTEYGDRVGEIADRVSWPRLLWAEGKHDEARTTLGDLIRDIDALRADHRDDLTLVYHVSYAYRLLASMTSGSDRRAALLESARAWHAWPATTFTAREEQKDLEAANK
jgi:tetratricopeptide (TPR) repeat protein